MIRIKPTVLYTYVRQTGQDGLARGNPCVPRGVSKTWTSHTELGREHKKEYADVREVLETVSCPSAANEHSAKSIGSSRFCEHIHENYLELAARCDPYVFQGWIDWMACTSKPKTKSYVTYWNWLSECYMFWFQKRIDQSTLSQVILAGTSSRTGNA